MLNITFIAFSVILIFIGSLGVYEHHLYPETSLVKYTTKIYFLGMVSLVLVGLTGLIALSVGYTFPITWSGYIIMAGVIFILLLLQRRIHTKLNLSTSPLQRKTYELLGMDTYEDLDDTGYEIELDINVDESKFEFVDVGEDIAEELEEEKEEDT